MNLSCDKDSEVSLPDSDHPLLLTKDKPRDTSSVVDVLSSEGSDPEGDDNAEVSFANKLTHGESSYDWELLGF